MQRLRGEVRVRDGAASPGIQCRHFPGYGFSSRCPSGRRRADGPFPSART